jgi:hypothetical protein
MNVISFSLWGTAPSYFYGLLDNCIIIKYKLPEFTCFVYHNNSLPKNIKDILEQLGNVRLIPMNNTNDKRNTMWRFLPAFYKNTNIVLSRDADSRIEPKEIKAIQDWLKSDKNFHIIRNNRGHKRKILAGLWGCRNKILRPLLKDYINYISKPYTINNWIVDEIFLEKIVYPYVMKLNTVYVNASHNRYEPKSSLHELDNSLPNEYESFIGCPTKKTHYINKYYPKLLKGIRLIKYRVGS